MTKMEKIICFVCILLVAWCIISIVDVNANNIGGNIDELKSWNMFSIFKGR